MMFSRIRTSRSVTRTLAPKFERLEDRTLLSVTPGLLDPAMVPKFVNPLPIPGVMEPIEPGGSHYEVSMSQFDQDLGLGLVGENGETMTTTVWGYNGSFPGPTIEARRDDPITVLWKNDLVDENDNPLPHLLPVDTSIHWAHPEGGLEEAGVPLVTHLHGGHTESASDGLPEAWFTPGFEQTGDYFVKETYAYDNDQEAATLWYHDHALGITRLNVYAGLAGFYLLRDDWEDNLNLPDGEHEVPIVIQDRMFTEEGQLYYPAEPEEEGQPAPSVLPEFFGDVILVNGKAWPVLDVDPTAYRLRLLNGSDSRVYKLWLSPDEMTEDDSGPLLNQIGTDVGLMYEPASMDKLTIAPGERADVVVDFSEFAGQTLIMRNNARSPYPKGDTIGEGTAGQIMAFRVGDIPAEPFELPETLRAEPFVVGGIEAETRELVLFEGEDEYGRLMPMLGTTEEGAMTWDEPITENPTLGDTEVWEVYNTTPDTHPIHLHLVAFEVLSRQKFKAEVNAETGVLEDIRLLGQPKQPAANEIGPKDTIQVNPGEVVRLRANFDRVGRYVWHCHILSHEDHEMMRPYEVIDAALAELDAEALTDFATAQYYGQRQIARRDKDSDNSITHLLLDDGFMA